MTNELYAKKIHARYTEKETTDIDTLKALDSKVKTPATAFAYIFGSISAMIMGSGMSLIMTDIGSLIGLAGFTVCGVSATLFFGLVSGLAGLILSLLTYPIYKGILDSRKKKYAPEILALSEKILNK